MVLGFSATGFDGVWGRGTRRKKRAHAGGAPPPEQSFGAWHGVTEFDWSAVEHNEQEPKRFTMNDMSFAIGEIVIWMMGDGKPSRRKGILVRSIVLGYMLKPDHLGIHKQSDLAREVGVSRQRISDVVMEFRERFGVALGTIQTSTAQKVRRGR